MIYSLDVLFIFLHIVYGNILGAITHEAAESFVRKKVDYLKQLKGEASDGEFYNF